MCRNLNPTDGYLIAGKLYSQAECEAVYEFWKEQLIYTEIETHIHALLSQWENANPDFVAWVLAHFDKCVEAVAKDREQEEMFNWLAVQDNDQDPLNVVETCLFELYKEEGEPS